MNTSFCSFSKLDSSMINRYSAFSSQRRHDKAAIYTLDENILSTDGMTHDSARTLHSRRRYSQYDVLKFLKLVVLSKCSSVGVQLTCRQTLSLLDKI